MPSPRWLSRNLKLCLAKNMKGKYKLYWNKEQDLNFKLKLSFRHRNAYAHIQTPQNLFEVDKCLKWVLKKCQNGAECPCLYKIESYLWKVSIQKKTFIFMEFSITFLTPTPPFTEGEKHFFPSQAVVNNIVFKMVIGSTPTRYGKFYIFFLFFL